ncbi:MAG: hypothetical protein FJY77_01185 [Candidatus Altiarchaeales archaeon]|nr:hypothetical protein [Candidatus Altiarchaeales archaeon]
MNPIYLALIAAAVIALLFLLFSGFIKNMLSKIFLLVLNSMGGVILLLLLKYVFGVEIPVNPYTLGTVLIFGLPALGTLLILHYGGMI